LAIDGADLELAQLTSAQARAVERQEQRAVIAILHSGDQPQNLVGTEDDPVRET